MISRVTNLSEEVETAIESLGTIFYRQAGLPGQFNAIAFIDFWRKCLASGIAAQWTSCQGDGIVGTIGMLLIMSPFDGKLVAEETFWFVHPDHRGTAGVRLFNEAETWARELQVDMIKVGYLHGIYAEKLHSFYERRGFNALQTQFVKHL